MTVGLTAGVWFLAAAAGSRARRARLPRDLGVLASGVVAGALLLVPFVLAAAGVTTGGSNALSNVVGANRNVRVTTFAEALRMTLGAPDGGLLDPKYASAQAWLATLSIAGLATCLLLRRNAAVIAAFAAWGFFLVAFLIDLPVAPLRAASGVYYNSYSRISGGLALLQWIAAGLAVSAAVGLLARLIGRLAGERRLRWTPPALAGATVLALVAVVCLPYARRDVDIIALRYQNPGYNRVDPYDLAAAAFVAKRIRPGERVMNNANDGSTFGYVFYDLRVVLDQPLGSAAGALHLRAAAAVQPVGRRPAHPGPRLPARHHLGDRRRRGAERGCAPPELGARRSVHGGARPAAPESGARPLPGRSVRARLGLGARPEAPRLPAVRGGLAAPAHARRTCRTSPDASSTRPSGVATTSRPSQSTASATPSSVEPSGRLTTTDVPTVEHQLR